MVVYAFYVFDRHGTHVSSGLIIMKSRQLIRPVAECIYKKRWAPQHTSSSKTSQANGVPDAQSQLKGLSVEDDAKLVFGTIFSLRNMVRKLGGPDDKYTAPGGKEGGTFTLLMVGGEVSYRIGRVTTSCTTTKLQLP